MSTVSERAPKHGGDAALAGLRVPEPLRRRSLKDRFTVQYVTDRRRPSSQGKSIVPGDRLRPHSAVGCGVTMTVDLLRHPDGERRPLDEASDSCGHRGEGAPRRGARARDTVPLMTPQDLFRLHPFLGALTESESRELLAHAVRRRVPAGHVVFRKDDPGDGLYGVLGGRIVVTVESAAGKELILNMFGPGEFFGEIALLDGKGRTATAIAREPSELLFLGRAVFQPFLAQRPDATMRIIALLCSRLRRTTDLVEDGAFLGVATRLAKQLVVLMDRYGRPEVAKAGGVDSAAPTLHISQEELARTLGVSREIVSRQLAIWREAGIVELGRSRLTVLDLQALYGIIAGG